MLAGLVGGKVCPAQEHVGTVGDEGDDEQHPQHNENDLAGSKAALFFLGGVFAGGIGGVGAALYRYAAGGEAGLTGLAGLAARHVLVAGLVGKGGGGDDVVAVGLPVGACHQPPASVSHHFGGGVAQLCGTGTCG